jgi:hypothetical protein
VVEVAAEKNSTLVLPFPVELLRFLERAATPAAPKDADKPAPPPSDPPPGAPPSPTAVEAGPDGLVGRDLVDPAPRQRSGAE